MTTLYLMVFDLCYAKLRYHNSSMGVSKNYKSILNELKGRYVFTLLIIPILPEIILQIALCPPPFPSSSPFLLLLRLLLFLLFILIIHQFLLHNFLLLSLSPPSPLSLSLSLFLSLSVSLSLTLFDQVILKLESWCEKSWFFPLYIYFFQTKMKEKQFSYSHMPMVSCLIAPACGSDTQTISSESAWSVFR